MSILKGVRDFLLADTDVAEIFGTRIYRDRAPQGAARPYVVVQRVGTTRPYHLNNQGSAAATLVQVDAYVDTPNTVDSYGEPIRNRMSGYRGAMGSETVLDCTIERDTDAADVPADASDDWRYRRSFDFLINHVEVEPTHVGGGD